MSCSGENCNNTHIQNKKYNLCGECVFKKSHGGKSRAEVYMERSKKKLVNNVIEISRKILPVLLIGKVSVFQDEESAKNERNQDIAEQREKEEQGFPIDYSKSRVGVMSINKFGESIITFGKLPPRKNKIRKSKPKKKQKSVKKITEKQSEINRLYKLTCIDMDHVTEPVCTGCLKYQGGDIKLSHSHIISREDCKRIGRLDLISDRDNITYHCMTFAGNDGCHSKWENPAQRHTLNDYKKNIEYIKSIDEGLYLKYINKK